MLILTQYIAKHELKALQRHFDVEDILEGGRKVLKSLAVEVKAPRKLNSARFFKVRIGTKNTGRMMVFLMTNNQKIIPLLIRLKKDKIFGMNMSINNTDVLAQINKNLDHVLSDIEKGKWEGFDL